MVAEALSGRAFQELDALLQPFAQVAFGVRVLADDRGAKLDREHEGRRHRQTERRHARQIGGFGANRVGRMWFRRSAADTHDMHGSNPSLGRQIVMMCRRSRCPKPANRSVARSMARASSITESDVATSKPPANTRAVTSRSRASAACSASMRRMTALSASSESARRPSGTSTAAASPEAAASVAVVATAHSSASVESSAGSIPGRRQRGDESGLLQFVDGFLDAIHQLFDDRSGVEAGGFLAGFEGNAIRLALDQAGSCRKALAVVRAACLQRGDMVGDRGGDVVRQSDLAQDDRKQRAVDAFQAPDQIGLDLVADQPDRRPAVSASVETRIAVLRKSTAALRPSA